jgi:hypothetical protein
MNLKNTSGSPTAASACPNRVQDSLFRHSPTASVNLQTEPTLATEEPCTPPGALRRTNLGRDAFHPRPTAFRRDQINKARTLTRAPKPFRPDSTPHSPTTHFSLALSVALKPFVFFVPFGVPLIDFLLSDIHFTPDFLRFFEIFDFDFKHQQQMKKRSSLQPGLNPRAHIQPVRLALFDFDFELKNEPKTASPTLN